MNSMPPMLLDSLLILDLLLLAATLWLAGRLLARARVDLPAEIENENAEEFFSTGAAIEERNWFAERPAQMLVVDEPARIEVIPSPPPALPVDFASNAAPLPQQEQEHLQFRELGAAADLFADPLDGTLFLDGEEIFVCQCGVGYHAETWEWIRTQHAEKCVHCGALNKVEKRIVPARG